jgi:hypothetical protein
MAKCCIWSIIVQITKDRRWVMPRITRDKADAQQKADVENAIQYVEGYKDYSATPVKTVCLRTAPTFY